MGPWGRVAIGRLLSARDLPATPPRLEGEAPLTYHGRRPPRLRARFSRIVRVTKKLPLTTKFLVTEPVVGVLGGYLILLYVLLFSFLSGFDYVFKATYELPIGFVGSCFGAITADTTFIALFTPVFFT